MCTPDGSRTLIGKIPDNVYTHAEDLESEGQGPKERARNTTANGRHGSYYTALNMTDRRDRDGRDSGGIMRGKGTGRGWEGDRDIGEGNREKEKDRDREDREKGREHGRRDMNNEWGSHRDRDRDNDNDGERDSENDDVTDRGVNFEVYEGDRVLIAGPSGTGKSSLLRAIAGLWELGSGRIIWNTGSDCDTCRVKAPKGVFFLPQKPYNVLGSLRQQISYPEICPDGITDRMPSGMHGITSNPMHARDDVDLLELLRLVRLDNLAVRMGAGDEVAGLTVCKDWSKVRHNLVTDDVKLYYIILMNSI